ncbi:MAG TPA: hypothetical protein VLA93_11745 [Pyrinomonadaceae bacterium]|nr:hypothetical protein [Pyrinomonadaceae bacterium]
MKSFMLVSLVLIGVTFPLSAQTQNRAKPQEPESILEPQVNPNNWKEFSSIEGRFSIVAPGALEQREQVVMTQLGIPVKLHFFSIFVNAQYTVSYGDEGSPIEGTGKEKMFLETFRDLGVQAVKGRLLNDLEIKFEGHPARLYTMEYGTEIKHLLTAKTIIVGRRFYIISTTYSREMSPETLRIHEEWAARFRDSFRLHPVVQDPSSPNPLNLN